MTDGWIERRALRILQNDDTPLYLFALAQPAISTPTTERLETASA